MSTKAIVLSITSKSKHYIRWLILISGSIIAATGIVILLTPEESESAQKLNTKIPFDLQRSIVPVKEILSGGPPKDGIPAIDNPQFVDAIAVDYLENEDRIIGLTINKEFRAYPISILNYHEIINDRAGNEIFAVTYCPLCDSVAVINRKTSTGETTFGVSGLLYNSNVLMYDRSGKPESLWSQVKTVGISGPGASQQLSYLPCELTTWGAWKTRFPKTKVLSTKTGYQRNYKKNPYSTYFDNNNLMFDVSPKNLKYENKIRILGVWTGNHYRAYLESIFSRDKTKITDTIDGKQIIIEYDIDSKSMRISKADEGVRWIYTFWFAWYAMHPDTSVFGESK